MNIAFPQIFAPMYGHRWQGASLQGIGRIKQIRFCSAEQIRFRTIVKRARMRPTGKVWSWKNCRTMHWESPYERDAFQLLNFRWDVIAYREQSCEIIYTDDAGEESTHYPDIEVLTISSHELWEVKTEYHSNRTPVSRRTEILKRALFPYGLIYDVAIAEKLSNRHRLNTMQKILHFGNRPVSTVERYNVACEMVQNGVSTWGDACSGRFGSNGREILSRLVLEGFLKIDTDSPFGRTTEFVLGDRSW